VPFPFLPLGWVLAVTVLVGALTLFGLALRAMDRAATRVGGELRATILPGLVAGLRDWQPARAARPTTPPPRPSGIEIVDLAGTPEADASRPSPPR
jgi:hypothetical protein